MPANPPDSDAPLVLFDGQCHFCRSSVRFMQCHRGSGPQLRFASLQSDVGRAALVGHGFPADYLESVVLIEDGVAYTESTAAWRMGRYLSWPWNAAALGRLVPRSWRDAAYHWVSDHRSGLRGPGCLC